MAGEFFQRVVELAKPTRQLVSDEHFAVRRTLIEAWASRWRLSPERGETSDRPPPGRPVQSIRELSRGKAPQQPARVDNGSESRLARKGDNQPAKLCYAEHMLMENQERFDRRSGIWRN